MSATCNGITRQDQPCRNQVANPGENCGRCLGPASDYGGLRQDRADKVEGSEVLGRLAAKRHSAYEEAASTMLEVADHLMDTSVDMARQYYPDVDAVEFWYASGPNVPGFDEYKTAYVEVGPVDGTTVYIASESVEGSTVLPTDREIRYVPDDEFFEFERIGHSLKLAGELHSDVA